jgi:hypothetical protein
MKRRSFGYGGLLLACLALGSCSNSAVSLAPGGNAAVPRFVRGPVHPDRRSSWMSLGAKSSKLLLYVGDDETDDVYVYDYKSGKSVGTLTGFSGPYGMCVDAKGDIYIANFESQDAVEYAHGGTKILNTYHVSGGTPIGCSVDSKGDVAVTSFDPAEVDVFTGGNPSDGTSYSGSPCYYLWTMGYDHSGNLIGGGEGEDGGIEFCGLLSGSTSVTSLSFSQKINFPGGTMWDGKYIAVGDQETGGAFQTGIYQSTLSGSTLTEHTDTVLSATCYNNYSDVVQPFIVGLKNTAANKHQGTIVVGSNLWCADGSTGGQVECWNYPTGGSPVSNVSSPPEEPYGQSVSLPAHGALGVHRSINPTCDSGV